jgi:CheY-like chemotaxis protein/anti-sigma regulatory factor (Ser/Thr protein kinase)
MAGAKRILIADADPEVHRLLLTALEGPGRRVDSTYGVSEALRAVASVRYDLVLADVSMGDDLGLLERLREVRPPVKVVVMTGESTPERIVQSIREQAFAYFSKPFAVRSVADMVGKALESASHEDDIQVVSASPNWLSFRVRCKMETAERIVQFLRELPTDLPLAERENIASAIREILVNSMEHGCESDPEKWVRITYVRTGRAIIYHVGDPGGGFSFRDLSHAAVSNRADAPFEHSEVRDRLGMRPGGFGIMLARHMVDELIYNEAGNEALLIKYLG